MKAQVIRKFGEPSVFELVDLAKPELKPGHVLIKVYATSVNPIDCKIRSGMVSAIAPEFPAILHGDVAGIIEAVASDIQQFNIGDEVYGCAGGLKGSPGALAQYMLVDAKLIAKKPKSLSLLQAAALPLVCITAWEALFTKARLTPQNSLYSQQLAFQQGASERVEGVYTQYMTDDERACNTAEKSNAKSILIHGGAGGVGHIAVQLAKWCGANVFATVRKESDFSLVAGFGADEVINAEAETVEEYVARLTDNQGFDIVFDTVGGANLEKSFVAAGTNGSVITIAARGVHDLTPIHNKALSLHAVFMLLPILNNQYREAYAGILTQIAEIVDEGKLRPMIDPRLFTLETIADAHALLESGNAQGKVVVCI